MSDVTATKKRLPFKRTAPRKKIPETSGNDDDDGLGFFRRSAESFRAAFQERQRDLADDEKPPAPAESLATEEGHETKRRKVSADRSGDDESRPRSRSSRPRSRKGGSMPLLDEPATKSALLSVDSDSDDVILDVQGKGKEVIRNFSRRTPRKTPPSAKARVDPSNDGSVFGTPSKRLRSTSRKASSAAIEILSDDDDDADVSSRRKQPVAKPMRVVDGDDPVSEAEPAEPLDEFAEYILKARERAAQAKKAKEAKLSSGGALASMTAPTTYDDDDGYGDKDPALCILMTSRLEGTKPVKVRRKLTQDMVLPLEAWVCKQRDQQGFDIPDGVAARLFLTWKGNQIYPTTSAATLGIEIDSLGQIRVPGPHGESSAPPASNEEGFTRGGIVLEVWTEDAYAAFQAERERERLRSLGQLDDDDDYYYGERSASDRTAGDDGGGAGQERGKGIKIILKAKDSDPVTVTAHMDTPLGSLVDLFRSKRDIPPEQDVALYFDGDRLEENMLLEALDVDPDDTNLLEVHFR